MNKEGVVELIIDGLKEIIKEKSKNHEIPPEAFNESTFLIGKRSFIDSLTLVSLIVDIEQRLNDELGISISIADERAMSQEKSPFRTIGSLAEYAHLLIKENLRNE